MLEILKKYYYIDRGQCEYFDGCVKWSRIGTLRWRVSGGVGPSKHSAGDIVGCLHFGYRNTKIKFNNKKISLKCHRIVKMLELDRMLDDSEIVDHIDGNRENNDPLNLRLVTHIENARNKRAARSDSSSRLMGVSRIPSNKWRVRFQVKSRIKDRHVGVFSRAFDACNAYWDARIESEPDMVSTWESIRKVQLEIAFKLDNEGSNESV